MLEPLIRLAEERDVQAIAKIYGYHVLHGTASFEEVPPDVQEMVSRWKKLSERGYPWLVAAVDHNTVGYAYAGPYKERSAYRYTVEDSVYIARDYMQQGLGRKLLSRLIDVCMTRHFQQMMAVIGDSQNTGSISLHSALGFRRVGLAESIGFKHGRHLDVVYMQRAL